MVPLRHIVPLLLLGACVPRGADDGSVPVLTAGVPTVINLPEIEKAETLREAIVRIARAEVGTLEVDGNNRGPGPKKYLASVGLPEGPPYCAAAQYWCYLQAGVVPPGPRHEFARAAYWHTGRRLNPEDSVMQADLSGYFYSSLNRIGHTEIVVGESKKYWRVVGFNTTDGMSRDGEGVFEKMVLKSQTTCTSRWLIE